MEGNARERDSQQLKRIVEKEIVPSGRLVSPCHLFVSVTPIENRPRLRNKEYLNKQSGRVSGLYTLSEKFLNSPLKSEEEGGPDA
jgi:hypothetical protein